MKITAKQYARAFYDSVANKSAKEVEQVAANFSELLKHNNDLGLFDSILREVEIVFRLEGGELEVNLISARKLSVAVVEQLKEYVAKKTGAKKIIFSEQVDASLIGGFVLRYEDKVIDGSIKNNLANLKKQLSN